MHYRSMILGFACGAVLSLGHFSCTSLEAAEGVTDSKASVTAEVRSDTAEVRNEPDQLAARLVAGMGSADKIMDFLEYLVVNLAKQEKSWKDNIQPNLEIFLFGVATDQPIRFDYVFDAEHGGQIQTILPMTDLKEFLLDNLDPIGISSDRDRKDRNLYELTGEVYEGWLRYLPEPTPYSVIFPQKEMIPADMEHPEKIHNQFIKKDLIAFMLLENTPEKAAERKTAFEKLRQVSDEKFEKLSSETRDQFELRKQLRTQTYDVLQQWLVETKRAELTAVIDPEHGKLPADLTFTALPETSIARDLKTLQERGSKFAGIQAPENNVLTVRVNVPMNAERIPGAQKVNELARPVVKDRIDSDANASAEEKAAMNEIATMTLDVLSANIDPKNSVDLFIDVYPAKEHHAIVLGVAAEGKETFTKIIEKLPAAQQGWTVEKNVDKVGETDIHRVTFGENPPKSLVDFYGDSNEAFLAVGEEIVWLAGGDGSLASLKEHIEIADKTEPGPGDGTMVIAEMNAYPVIQSYDAIMNDPELAFLKQMNLKGRVQERVEERNASAKKKGEEKKPVNRAGNLANFIWIPTALANMKGLDDRLTLEVKLGEDGVVVGHSDAQIGVLKGIGALIAKFWDENLQ